LTKLQTKLSWLRFYGSLCRYAIQKDYRSRTSPPIMSYQKIANDEISLS